MGAVLVFGIGHKTEPPGQTWLDDSDVESIIARSTKVRVQFQGAMQTQFQTWTTNPADPEDQGGTLVLVANHFSTAHELLTQAIKDTRKNPSPWYRGDPRHRT